MRGAGVEARRVALNSSGKVSELLLVGREHSHEVGVDLALKHSLPSEFLQLASQEIKPSVARGIAGEGALNRR